MLDSAGWMREGGTGTFVMRYGGARGMSTPSKQRLDVIGHFSMDAQEWR
jgi:hypothetical protein